MTRPAGSRAERGEVRERIIAATMDLLDEGKEANAVSVRQIAARARTSPGLINYHFGTRDNLIRTCIQRLVSWALVQWLMSTETEPSGRTEGITELLQ